MKNNALDNLDDVLTPDEIPVILKIGKSSTYNLLKSGELKSIRVAGKYRIPKQYLLEFLGVNENENEKENE